MCPDGTTAPSPASLDSWLSEVDGMQCWPPTMMKDIGTFLEKHDPSREENTFSKRLSSEYKDQKGFSYFSSQWLFEVKYHDISTISNYCFLKANCRPSMRLDNPSHEVWVLIEKKTGVIQSGICSCFAGHGQTCNHIAALLFKVDFCWQNGFIRKAVTDKQCMWKNKAKSKNIIPQQIRDLTIVKPKASRATPATSSHTTERTNFKPLNEAKGMSYSEFLGELKVINPGSVVLGEMEDTRYHMYEEWGKKKVVKSIQYPPSLKELSSDAITTQDVIRNVSTISHCDIQNLEAATRGQADNPLWGEQRVGRCTASNVKDIYTRSKSLQNQPDTDPTRLVNIILGCSSVPEHIPAIKYGRRMESVAVDKYASIMKRSHKNVNVSECGLCVLKDNAYIAASPDRLVSCCCGTGVLEVKCPLTSAGKEPSPETVSCLMYGDHDIVILKRSHQYYYQVQTQLAVTGKSWGDFFVYSQAGYYLERIVFDEAWWAEVLPCLTYFWEKCVAPALMLDSQVVISEDLQDPLNQGSDIMPERRSNSPPTVLNPTTTTASPSTEVRKRKAAPVRGQKKGKSKGRRRHSKTVYECGHCFDTIKDNVGNEEENSVQCDGCDTWYHFTCVGQSSATLDLMDKWFCSDCP